MVKSATALTAAERKEARKKPRQTEFPPRMSMAPNGSINTLVGAEHTRGEPYPAAESTTLATASKPPRAAKPKPEKIVTVKLPKVFDHTFAANTNVHFGKDIHGKQLNANVSPLPRGSRLDIIWRTLRDGMTVQQFLATPGLQMVSLTMWFRQGYITLTKTVGGTPAEITPVKQGELNMSDHPENPAPEPEEGEEEGSEEQKVPQDTTYPHPKRAEEIETP